ncbi:MAG: S8 family serine peptidase [Promethearchaeota archaeon]
MNRIKKITNFEEVLLLVFIFIGSICVGLSPNLATADLNSTNNSTIIPIISPLKTDFSSEISEWRTQFQGVDTDGNGMSDGLDDSLLYLTNNGILEKVKDIPMNLEQFDVIQSNNQHVAAESIDIIIKSTEADLDGVIQKFGEFGGLLKSDFSPFLSSFGGKMSITQLEAFRQSLIVSEMPFFIEEDGIAEANMYYAGVNMNLRPYVWNTLGYDGDNTSAIAILDTGIDESHPMHSGFASGDYEAKVVGWRDETSNNIQTAPYDDNGHGSHCSGISTGEGNPTVDGSGRTVASNNLEMDYTGYILSIQTISFRVTTFNVTGPGDIELNSQYLDLSSSLDFCDGSVYLYHGDTLVANYVPGTTSWSNTLIYTVPSNELGEYNVRVGLDLQDGDNSGSVTNFACAFQVTSHFFFNENLMDAGNAWRGVADDTHLVGVKVLDSKGSGSYTDIIDGINWVIANKEIYNITVISMSLGGSTSTTLIDAVNNAVNEGIVVVVSAGNSGAGGNNVGCPGNADNVLTVAAMNVFDQTTSYSSQGGSSYSGATTKPDITAPGGSVTALQMFSTDANDGDGYFTDNYANDQMGAQGTSMSAPAVAGAANLLIEAMGGRANWGYTPIQAKFVKSLLLMTATETYPLLREVDTSYSPLLNRGTKDVHEGYGRVNIDMAIEAYTQQLTEGSTLSYNIGSSDVSPSIKHGFGSYMDLVSGKSYNITLEVPDGADFDLYIYNDDPTSIGEPILEASGISSVLGGDESVVVIPSETDRYYVVVKAISGGGLAQLSIPGVEHDLYVSLDAPSSMVLGDTYTLTSTVYNGGTSDESDVNITLYIDSVVANSTIIPSLTSETSFPITYSWTPTSDSLFNITAYVPPLAGEYSELNNKISQIVSGNILAEAVDNYGMIFTTGGNANWDYQTTTRYYGGDAARSGTITHSQSTWMETTVEGPGALRFYYYISSESNHDYLNLYVDGVSVFATSGNSAGFLERNQTITSGTHTIRWTYSKDSSLSSYSDCAWVDYVQWTPLLPPSSPQNLVVTPGTAQIDLNWEAPSNNGGFAITNYRIYRGTTSGSETLLATIGNLLTYIDSAVINGQIYYYTVVAVNANGDSPHSNEDFATPFGATSVPSSPQNLQVSHGNTQVTLDWEVPSSYGGATIVNYRIYRDGILIDSVAGDILSYTDSGLSNEQTYSYQVSAVNSVGEGVLSDPITATPRVQIPHSPISIVGNYAFSTMATAEGWAGTGTQANPYIIENYEIITTSDNAIYILATSVYFIIQNCILDAVVTGIYISGVNAQIVNNVVMNSERGILINNGNNVKVMNNFIHDISNYGISAWRSSDTDIVSNIILNDDSSFNLLYGSSNCNISQNYIQGGKYGIWLSNDASYNIIDSNTIVAPLFNDVIIYEGSFNTVSNNWALEKGVYSVTSGTGNVFIDNIDSPSIVLNIPILLSNHPIPSGDGWISLDWDNVPDATSYQIYRSTSEITTLNGLIPISITTESVYQEKSFGLYYYTVRAGNSLGISNPTYRSPSAPQNLGGIAGINEITLSWDTPSWDGGTEITGYNVYRGTSPGSLSLHASLGTDLTYTDGGLTNGQKYYYAVAAVNALGTGPRSNEVNVTPVVELVAPEWSNIVESANPLELGNIETITITATDNAAVNSVVINIDSEDHLMTFMGGNLYQYSWTPNIIGKVTYSITVYDTSGNIAITPTYTINVLDTTTPIWVFPPVDQTMELGNSLTYDVDASDLDGVASYWISDTVNFAIDGSGTITNAVTLAVGIYSLEIRGYDASGNYCTATITVTVQDTSAPTWASVPADQTVELGSNLSYDVDASDLDGIASYWISDTVNFAIDGSGTITNVVALSISTYSLQIRVYDLSGNYCFATITVTVQDTTAPAWVFTPVDQMVEFGNSLTYDVDATDLGGIASYWISDTVNFAIDGSGTITNTVALSVGSYTLELRAYDVSGYYCTATITVTVQDTTVPVWASIPTDQTVELGNSFSYDVGATDLGGIASYWINDTADFVIDGSGTITNATVIPVGSYTLELRVYDASGNYCTATITVTVQDTTIPVWVSVPTDQTVELGNSFSYDVDATDLGGIASYWISDTLNFAIDGSGIITNTVGLVVGTYSLEIRAYDPSSNYCTATIMVTVQDTILPAWASIPTDQTVELGNSFSYDVGATDLGGIASYWINDTVNFVIDGSGTITNATVIPVGTYDLEIRAYDNSGNLISTIISITTTDAGSDQDNGGIPGYIWFGGIILIAIVPSLKRVRRNISKK